jgi:hypothetical protein
MIKMIDPRSSTNMNLNELILYLNYQGPLYLRKLENLSQTPLNVSSTLLAHLV